MVYAKGIRNVQASVGLDVDGNNVLNFSYEVQENYDSDSGAFNSMNQYSYYIPVSKITLKLVENLYAGQTDYFEIHWGQNQIAFGQGEYYSIDLGQLLNPAEVYALISGAIYP
mgnify:CR=1 FL=1